MFAAGIGKGIERGLRDAIAQVCATRTLELGAAHRAKLSAEVGAPTLREWLTPRAAA